MPTHHRRFLEGLALLEHAEPADERNRMQQGAGVLGLLLSLVALALISGPSTDQRHRILVRFAGRLARALQRDAREQRRLDRGLADAHGTPRSDRFSRR